MGFSNMMAMIALAQAEGFGVLPRCDKCNCLLTERKRAVKYTLAGQTLLCVGCAKTERDQEFILYPREPEQVETAEHKKLRIKRKKKRSKR